MKKIQPDITQKIEVPESILRSFYIKVMQLKTAIMSLQQGIANFEREVLETGTLYFIPIPFCTKL